MNNNRQLIPVIIIIVIILIVGVGIFQALTKKGPTAPVPAPTPKPVTLTDYVDNSDASVRLTILGRIVAKEHHLDQTITISIGHRDLEIARGYTGTAELSSGFDNNQPAFEDFMRALDADGFTRTITPKKNVKVAASETGLCPNGNRYDYDLIVGGQTLYHAWSTSCGDPTTFGGVGPAIQALFTSQIPDYNKLVSTVKP